MQREWILPAVVTLLVLFVSGLEAIAAGGDVIPGSRYVSGRGAALGDAYIPLADDTASALFYNPAALGRGKELIRAEPFNLSFQGNSDFVGQLGTSAFKFPSLSSYTKSGANKNSFPGAGVAFAPAFAIKGFGFGLLAQSRLASHSNGTTVRYKSLYQLIPTAGYGMNLASGVLRLGYSFQWVNQVSGDVSVPAGSVTSYNTGSAQGSGFSHNFGMQLTLPYAYLPSINIVARNVGGVRYTGKPVMSYAKNATGKIPDESMSLDAAVGFVGKISEASDLVQSYEYRDALNVSKISPLGHLAAGLEFKLRNVIFFRGGLGSGYPTAGFGIRSKRAEVNFSWYSEEDGKKFRSERDVRYQFQFIMRTF